MKVLITYFSNTGNTEKVAYSIKEGMEGHDIDLLKVKDLDPNSLKKYDLVILGSGIYAGKIAKDIVDLVKNAQTLPQKFAFFCTHASPNLYQKGWKLIRKRIKEENLSIIGEFDCYGEQLGIPIEMRMAMLEKLPPNEQEKAKKHMEDLKDRPNTEDLLSARNFGRSLVN